MNGERVGTWSRSPSNVERFAYDPLWLASPHTRPLSLTLPFLPGNAVHSGPHVAAWFDNLLPDSRDMRARVARRFRVQDTTRSLLTQIGRDCVGAVHILPLNDEPHRSATLEVDPLTEADVASALRHVTSTDRVGTGGVPDDAFRMSVAGAQEKTALLRLDGRWYRPRGSTPTTHLLKLPLGLVGNMRYDLQHSIANEWLCLHLLEALGFPVAKTEMAVFADHIGSESALVVERFDRRWRSDLGGLVRLPQEDLCQATGTAPERKYESDGGPGVTQIIHLLRGSVAPQDNVRTFVLAQLAFWLLAAIDGHGKNFSIFLRRDGYTLTPLYDVLSAWPIIGHAPNALPVQRVKLAMAIRCKSRHYEMQRITTRHWRCLSDQSGVPFREMSELVQRVPSALDTIAAILPANFPSQTFTAIAAGMRQNAQRFLTPDLP